MRKLKDLKIECEDVFRTKDIQLTYTENNQYYEIKDKEENMIIIPKFLIINGSVFKVLLSDLGFEGNFFTCDYCDCTIELNLHLRNIKNVEYRFFEAVIFAFWYSIDQLRIEKEITDALYAIITSSLYKIIKENKITFTKNYNRYRDELFKIPNKIKIMGTEYKVNMCKNLKANEQDVFGVFCNKLSPNYGIYIAAECKDRPIDYSSSCMTFIHELTHGILFETMYDMPGEEEADKEEQICDFMAYRICDFLRNNDFEIHFK